MNSPRFAYRCCERSPASPISAESYAAVIILAVAAIWRQFYCRFVARTASPILAEQTYNLGSTDWKRKYGKTKIKSKQNHKRMPSTTVRGPYASNNTIFDPP